MQPLKEHDGLAAFDYLMQDARRDVCLAYGALSSIDESLNGDARTNLDSRAGARALGTPSIDKSDAEAIQKNVKQVLSELTRIDASALSSSDHFTDYGVDSILLQGFVKKVNQAYGLDLTSLDFHNHPTIAELSECIRLRGAESIAGEDQETAASAPSKPLVATGVPDGDIAIIGVNLRVPGAASLEEFWHLVMGDCRSASAYPEERWKHLPTALTEGKRRDDYPGFFLEDVMGFDHQLFKTSPREAMLMDPQQRLLLQSVWQAIENAGYSRREFSRKRTSVLLSIDAIDYEDIVAFDGHIDEFTGSGTSRYIAANRISHFFNLRGMSETVDTACSSFFVGLDRAADSLHKGLSEQAIVAAAQLNLSPTRFRILKEKGLLSSRGRTLPFDQDADGFVRSEGIGAVVLKPLAQALRDKDHVYAILKGVGVWHAGKALGVTAPNSSAHQEAMTQALRKAAISIDRISYLEAHGTGMSMGDASEVNAFAQVFKDLKRDPEKKCALSAAKSTLGHMEAASGMAVLIKAILALRNGQVPGIPGFRKLHSEIDLHGLQVSELPQSLSRAQEDAGGPPHCVGLHSYGLGGVSAFVVLEDYTKSRLHRKKSDSPSSELFVISAQSKKVLDAYVKKASRYLSGDLAGDISVDFQQLVSTYQLHREHMPHRLAIVAGGVSDLVAKIEAIANGEIVSGVYSSENASGNEAADEPTLKRFVEERNWNPVAKAWVAGAEIPWAGAENPRHPFPEYPFDTDRKFWISLQERREEKGHEHLLLPV